MRARFPLLLWSATIVYISLLLLAPSGVLPGDPVWAIQQETIDEVLGESLNFFFVLPLLHAAGVRVMEAATLHPADEAFFNFAEVWIFMFLPLLWTDARGEKLPRTAIWSGAMFLTNIFLMPYMALRLGGEAEGAPAEKSPQQSPEKPAIAKLFGWIGIVVGSLAVSWLVYARPEFGTLADRGEYWLTRLVGDRVTLAFFCDVLLFWAFQVWLIGDIEPEGSPTRGLRFVPFWGLAFWLVL